MYYRENKIYCGENYTDVQIYPVFPIARSRSKRKAPTSDVQQKLNAENAAKKLTRILHTNFTKNDYALHLTYDDGNLPENPEEAKRDIQNFIRRAKRLYAKAGIENIKYVYVTEKGKTSDRVHHHVIISGGASRSKLEELWGSGYANSKKLRFNKNGIAGLAHYMVKQPLYFKRWSGSRNLKQPREVKNDSRITHSAAKKLFKNISDFEQFCAVYPGFKKIYKDFAVADIQAVQNGYNAGFYFSVRLYRTAYVE